MLPLWFLLALVGIAVAVFAHWGLGIAIVVVAVVLAVLPYVRGAAGPRARR